MARPAPIGQEALLAAVMDLHKRDRWNGLTWMGDGPLRRALIKAGLLMRRPKGVVQLRGWVLTPAARELLVNVPGSGITRREEPDHG